MADNDASWRNERHWNYGLYFSKDDSRLWVPKQVVWMGWTINLGHPAAPALLLGTLFGAMATTAFACAYRK